MSQTCALVKRNIKLFFKDKGMFFTSLITPAILLVLYITFLGGVYEESFTASLPDTLQLSEGVVKRFGRRTAGFFYSCRILCDGCLLL